MFVWPLLHYHILFAWPFVEVVCTSFCLSLQPAAYLHSACFSIDGEKFLFQEVCLKLSPAQQV